MLSIVRIWVFSSWEKNALYPLVQCLFCICTCAYVGELLLNVALNTNDHYHTLCTYTCSYVVEILSVAFNTNY